MRAACARGPGSCRRAPVASGVPPGTNSARRRREAARARSARPSTTSRAYGVDHEALLGELDRRRDELRPRLRAELLVRCPAGRRRCPGTPTARWPVTRSVAGLALCVEVHVAAAGGRARSRGSRARGRRRRCATTMKPPPPMLPARRVRHRQRERRRDRRVDGVAAVAQHLAPTSRRERAVGHDHAVLAFRGGLVERERPAWRGRGALPRCPVPRQWRTWTALDWGRACARRAARTRRGRLQVGESCRPLYGDARPTAPTCRRRVGRDPLRRRSPRTRSSSARRQSA